MPKYLFEKKLIINFLKLLKIYKFGFFFLQIYRYSEIISNTHLFPLHNEPSPMHLG